MILCPVRYQWLNYIINTKWKPKTRKETHMHCILAGWNSDVLLLLYDMEIERQNKKWKWKLSIKSKWYVEKGRNKQISPHMMCYKKFIV